MSHSKPNSSWLVFNWTLAVLCILARLLSNHLLTYDTWWHLAMGKQILRDWQIPPPEIFSFTAQGVSTHYHSWLAGVSFELIHAGVGLGALELFAAFLVVVTAVLCVRISVALGSSEFLACFAIPAFFLFAGPFLIIRPHLFTFLGFAFLLHHYLKGSRTWSLSAAFVLLLFALWANLHGGFLLGLVFLAGLIGLEMCASMLYGKPFCQRPSQLILLFIAAVAGCFIHPQGLGQLKNVLLHDPLAQGVHLHINEWLPPSQQMILAISLLGLLGLVLAVRSRALFLAVMVAVFTIPAISVWRHLPLFAIAGVPAILAILTGALGGRRSSFNMSPKLQLPIKGILLLGILCGGLKVFASEKEILSTEWSANEFPVRAVQALSKEALGNNIFNPFEWGGFLLYSLPPPYRIYIDSRVIPYGSVYPDEFFKIWNVEPGWEEVLFIRQVDLVVVQPDSAIWKALVASSAWEIVYLDKTSGILKRRGMAPV